MMKPFILFFFLSFAGLAIAQKTPGYKLNPKAVEVFERGLAKLRDGETRAAIPFLKKAIELEPGFSEAVLSLAGTYGELKDYQSAVEYYEKGKALDTAGFKYYNLPYSINLAGLGRFDEALAAINSFLTISNLSDRSKRSGEYRKRSYEFAVEYGAKLPMGNYVFAPKNMGDSINSEKSEYYPSITIDDSTFVLTRRGPGFREDFYESNILPGKKYSKTKLIEGDINNPTSKGALHISQDGEWLLFAGYNFPGGYGDFDLYISYYTPTGWSEPENLGRNINTDAWESSPSLSPDNRALYFSSNRPGGYGGKDLYVSYRQPNGKWGPAQNMGPHINSAGDELAPFIHADNATLYFTSDGLQGYGSSDIFVCRKGPNNQWSTPENLGYPINTIENEGSLFVASDGKTAYYASDRADTRGGLDIYTFELRSEFRPARTLYVKGKVYDKKTGKGLPSAVELIDNATQAVVSNVQTDETGHYFITLPVGKDYTFTVNRKGYLYYTSTYALSKELADSTYKKDIALNPIEVSATMVLENVLFDTKSTELLPESMPEINKLLKLMKENPTIKVQINGHSDNVGKPADNLKLSEARAKAVVNYLVSKGIEPIRLAFKGFGETRPVADNKTEEGRALNRRTEFMILGQ